MHAFIRSECDEAQVRMALADAAPLYRNAPETETARASGSQVWATFIAEALPHAVRAAQHLATDLMKSTLTSVGASFSQVERQDEEIAPFAGAMADMFCAYLDQVNRCTGC